VGVNGSSVFAVVERQQRQLGLLPGAEEVAAAAAATAAEASTVAASAGTEQIVVQYSVNYT